MANVGVRSGRSSCSSISYSCSGSLSPRRLSPCSTSEPAALGPVRKYLFKQRRTRMATIHLHQTTTSTPEQFIAGLTDFGPGRSKLFGNSADDGLKVHAKGPK